MLKTDYLQHVYYFTAEPAFVVEIASVYSSVFFFGILVAFNHLFRNSPKTVFVVFLENRALVEGRLFEADFGLTGQRKEVPRDQPEVFLDDKSYGEN